MKSHLGRTGFSAMQLRQLFSGYVYSDFRVANEQPKHWHFWAPLLAYYTGAFSDELGSLTLDDVIDWHGQPFLQFATNQKIQPRWVPIHPALLAAGWHSYLAFIAQQQQHRILFDLPSKRGRYSEKLRIWFTGEGSREGYLQKCRIPSETAAGQKTTFSSFRVTFAELIQQADNAPMLTNYLLGLQQTSRVAPQQQLAQLQQIVHSLPNLTAGLTWQRYCDRSPA